MIAGKAFIIGLLVFAALLGWTWLRSLRSPWVQRRRGIVGWALAMLLFACIVALAKLFAPRL